ncbi:MAG TPA: hypothetical protein DD723_04055 [Candidatus Omnitrophica bacterium]|nr:MAG: hypothetical protein A2Z81_00245 [Omnitrophica WOR_2 bacterium GWA2_45_18]OGX19622.1 MAG: hypothetical protein A2Y04_02790 [Omnitrophica WOR_2 bacterium GWC2_45_7]HBR14704.1 hypothetical protein [Candidatus Omnitrophota bacterium]
MKAVFENRSFFEKAIDILYEDDSYIIFNKPSGLLVIPTFKEEKKTLVNIVNHQYASGGGAGRLYPCHRLDRETSGVIIFAKGKRHQQLMMEAFKRRAVTKKYIAFIHGRMSLQKGEFKSVIHDVDQKKFRNPSSAKMAITRYRVIDDMKSFSVVEVNPITGQTNQIRIHFSRDEHPLVGERKYAFARDYALKFRRTALHASSVEFLHPLIRKLISVRAEMPRDMKEFMERH